jgi:ABC-type transport system involved in multi-copper enzyme maturation permease subunit
VSGARSFALLLGRELRELSASRSFWLLLLVLGALVGHAVSSSAQIYGEASGIGGGPSALSQGLSPLEGFVVPVFGSYDLAATLLLPFVVIRLFANERQTGALALSLQLPVPFRLVILSKAVALLLGWFVAFLPGLLALLVWRSAGGHLHAPETANVMLGHLLRGVLTIGIGAAAGALAASAASAAIIALTFTLGTWALDYVAAARGGAIATIAQYTPSSALRAFEHGELRAATVLILITAGVTGLALAAAWMHQGRAVRGRALRAAGIVAGAALACFAFSRLRASSDVSEDRRNSLPAADERALRGLRAPLGVTVNLAAEDPRLVDLGRVLAKLERVLPSMTITYAARSRSGLFERPDDHYGEVWYQLGERRAMSRSATEPIVLETIYELAGMSPPTPGNETPYPGYPLKVLPGAAPFVFFGLWPLIVIVAWWLVRRPRRARSSED